jgi:hypothetical protein
MGKSKEAEELLKEFELMREFEEAKELESQLELDGENDSGSRWPIPVKPIVGVFAAGALWAVTGGIVVPAAACLGAAAASLYQYKKPDDCG